VKKLFKLYKYSIKRILPLINLFEINPPYEYVQQINNQAVHSYIGLKKHELKKWVIVGGYLGQEVPYILRNYPNCEVIIFECSKKYIKKIKKIFKKNNRVKIIEKAVSNEEGKFSFYETNLKGSGSLLKVGSLSKESYGMEQEEVFEVECTTLDKILINDDIDVLQLDVQGAELKVLNGATCVLKKTKAIFTEISLKPNLYENSLTFDEIVDFLNQNDFEICLLGTDTNLTGNALFINRRNIL